MTAPITKSEIRSNVFLNTNLLSPLLPAHLPRYGYPDTSLIIKHSVLFFNCDFYHNQSSPFYKKMPGSPDHKGLLASLLWLGSLFEHLVQRAYPRRAGQFLAVQIVDLTVLYKIVHGDVVYIHIGAGAKPHLIILKTPEI